MAYPTQTPHKILLIANNYRTEEMLAGGTITPGDLIQVGSTGTAVVHPTAGGAAERLFATEDRLQGKGISDTYANGDRVTAALVQPGDVVYAWLADGQTVTPASYLTSNGAGKLKVATSTDIRIAKSLDTLDLTNSAVADGRIRVRII